VIALEDRLQVLEVSATPIAADRFTVPEGMKLLE